VDNLIGAQHVRSSDACAMGADIYSLGELDEFHTGSVRASDEDRNLQPNSRRAALLGGFHAYTFAH